MIAFLNDPNTYLWGFPAIIVAGISVYLFTIVNDKGIKNIYLSRLFAGLIIVINFPLNFLSSFFIAYHYIPESSQASMQEAGGALLAGLLITIEAVYLFSHQLKLAKRSIQSGKLSAKTAEIDYFGTNSAIILGTMMLYLGVIFFFLGALGAVESSMPDSSGVNYGLAFIMLLALIAVFVGPVMVIKFIVNWFSDRLSHLKAPELIPDKGVELPMDNKLLPIGTVVLVKEFPEKLMIVQRKVIIHDSHKDYCAIRQKNGTGPGENYYYFNQNLIEKILFTGLISEESLALDQQLTALSTEGDLK